MGRESLLNAVVVLHASVTLFMCGVIWFVQVVHYPLFAAVGAPFFRNYEDQHARRTTWVVAPPMLLELASAIALVAVRPSGMPVWMPIAGLGLLAIVWGSTAWAQVPQHRILGSGFEPRAHRALVRSNWIRTVGWSARGALALAMLVMSATA